MSLFAILKSNIFPFWMMSLGISREHLSSDTNFSPQDQERLTYARLEFTTPRFLEVINLCEVPTDKILSSQPISALLN